MKTRKLTESETALFRLLKWNVWRTMDDTHAAMRHKGYFKTSRSFNMAIHRMKERFYAVTENRLNERGTYTPLVRLTMLGESRIAAHLKQFSDSV